MAPQESLQMLVVDDDPDFAAMLEKVLKHEFTALVTTSKDCASARLALADSKFDVVTMDNGLPDGNGIDIMEEIVAVADHPPVVMVTGMGDEPTAVRAWRLGAAGYVIKDERLYTMLASEVRNALDHVHSTKLQHDSEVRYRRLFETARDGILILDTNSGRIIDANPFMTELLGYALEELLGRQLWEIGTFLDREQSMVAFQELMEKRYVRYEDLPLETREGKIIQVEFVSNIYMCDHTEVIQCNIRDISARREKEDVVRVSESWYRALYESSTDGIASSDMEGHITAANRAYLDMIGYSMHDVEKLTYQLLTPERWHKTEQDILENQVILRGYSDLYEKEYIRKDGSILPVSIRTWLVRDEDGNPAGLWEIIRDITEQKRAEADLRRVFLELDGFAHTVSHDLRNPLAAIQAGVTLLPSIIGNVSVSDDVMSELEDVVSLVARNVEKSSDLIEDLLTLAGVGPNVNGVSPVDIGDVVRGVLEEKAERIATDGISVEVVGDLGSINASPTHMYQLFVNLIGNAISHNDSESPKIEVRRLEDDGSGGHRYLVRDNGSGIPPESIDKIFVPFFKGESGNTGIGLSTVEKIVNVYNGEITARNDNGACFEFYLMDVEADP